MVRERGNFATRLITRPFIGANNPEEFSDVVPPKLEMKTRDADPKSVLSIQLAPTVKQEGYPLCCRRPRGRGWGISLSLVDPGMRGALCYLGRVLENAGRFPALQ